MLWRIVDEPIPLNQGCLAPVDVRIPDGCFLSPSSTAAVVGGNVLTSQRVTDVIFEAFEAAANSQGCMNNFTFGDKRLAITKPSVVPVRVQTLSVRAVRKRT